MTGLPIAPTVLPLKARSRQIEVRFAALEVALWAAVYGVYLGVRGMTIGAGGEAVRHAHDVLDAERAVGIAREAALQHLVAPVGDVFSAYYVLGFGPVVGAIVIWFGACRRDRYRELRNALLLSITLATIVTAFFPTAPPRLVAGLGISDTVGLVGHDTGSFVGIRFNPYAALPSMHVGWSVLVAVAGVRAVRRSWARACFLLHPVVMALAVAATGNHFFLDCAAGLAVAALTLGLPLRRGAGAS